MFLPDAIEHGQPPIRARPFVRPTRRPAEAKSRLMATPMNLSLVQLTSTPSSPSRRLARGSVDHYAESARCAGLAEEPGEHVSS